jgi:hypothetical protein
MGDHMADTITWEKDMGSALARAREQDLPVLLFFYNPD